MNDLLMESSPVACKFARAISVEMKFLYAT